MSTIACPGLCSICAAPPDKVCPNVAAKEVGALTFTCPRCGETSTAEQWNDATQACFSSEVIRIDGPEDVSSFHYCPECRRPSGFLDIIRATLAPQRD